MEMYQEKADRVVQLLKFEALWKDKVPHFTKNLIVEIVLRIS